MHKYFILPVVEVDPSFLHTDPAFTAAATGGVITNWAKRDSATNPTDVRFMTIEYGFVLAPQKH